MKIDNSGNAVEFYPPSGKVQQRTSDGDEDMSSVDLSSAPTESVAINPLATQINAVSLQMGSEPSFDSAKVAAIKSAIASGQFQIQPENIADGLIASTKELLAG